MTAQGETDEKNPDVAAKDEWEKLMMQVKTKSPEKQKELLDLITNLVKISGD